MMGIKDFCRMLGVIITALLVAAFIVLCVWGHVECKRQALENITGRPVGFWDAFWLGGK